MDTIRRLFRNGVDRYLEDRYVFIVLVIAATVLVSLSLYLPPNSFEDLFFLQPLERMRGGEVMYLDYYPAYPPLYFFITYGLILVTGGHQWGVVFGARVLSSVAICITVFLVYLIVKRVYGKKLAFASSIIFLLGYSAISLSGANLMRNLTALFSVSTIYFLLEKKYVKSALCTGLGAMCYLMPILLLLPLLKSVEFRDKMKVLSTAIGIMTLLSAPFLLLNPSMYLSSYLFTLRRAPYETLWALMEGFYLSGPTLTFEHTFTPLSVLETQSATWPLIKQVEEGAYAVFYEWKRPYIRTSITAFLILLETAGYFLFDTQTRKDKLKYVAFTMTAFFLFSTSFSEGWGVFYSPFLIFAASSLIDLAVPALFYLTEGVGFLYFLNGFGGSNFWTWWDWHFAWNGKRTFFVVEVVFRTFLLGYTVFVLLSETEVVTIFINKVKSSFRLTRNRFYGLLLVGIIAFSITFVPFISIVMSTPDDDSYSVVENCSFDKLHPLTIKLSPKSEIMRYHFESTINATFTLFNDRGKKVFQSQPHILSTDYGTLNATTLHLKVETIEEREGLLTVSASEGHAKNIIDSLLPFTIVWIASLFLLSQLFPHITKNVKLRRSQ